MKKLVGGPNNYHYFLIFAFVIFSHNLFSSQIYDYQTEEFINKINTKIISVNSYKKQIKFRIIKDDFPNAFVTEENIIYLSSGLITHSPDYVSMLAVLAHEIGHLDKYHIKKRKKEINNFKNINSIGNMAAIIGSMIVKQPELINAVIVNKTTINNLLINFSQEQEIEADLYAVETLNNLQLPTDSVKKFLLILEDKTKFNYADEELKKFSTHPLFSTRLEIIDNKKIKETNKINSELQNNFNFIKAKFMAYTKSGEVDDLKDDYKIYYDAIQLAKSGNLVTSLKKINSLIIKYNKSVFLIETKGDILLSYGYNKEAIDFYKQVLIAQPNNNYAKYNIFTNLDFKKNNIASNKKIFRENQNLIYIFPKNEILIRKFYKLSKILNYPDWITFFEAILFDKTKEKIKLNNLKEITKDNNLKKLIKLYN